MNSSTLGTPSTVSELSLFELVQAPPPCAKNHSVLGSEDHGVPKAILRDARHVVSLESEHYGSYNVAVAGSIVMYDRLLKSQNNKK